MPGSALTDLVAPLLDLVRRTPYTEPKKAEVVYLVERAGLARIRVAEIPEQDGAEVVYFVEHEGLVKIGTTTNLKKRVKAISRGSAMIPGMTLGPVNLLASIPGGRPEEKELHRRFAHSRVDGEWFRLDDDLRKYIELLQTATDLRIAG